MSAPATAVAKARERLLTAQSENMELRNQQLRGTLVPASDVTDAVAAVEAEWHAILIKVRARMLAVPSRVIQQMLLPVEAKALIEDEIRAALTELATGTSASAEDAAG